MSRQSVCTTISTMVMAAAIALPITAAIGTQFTYQGMLADAGVPAEGSYDFRCLLYNADVGGSQVGSMLIFDAETVSEGRITLDLDFGAVFDGTELWLELHVRIAGTGGYTILTPRQKLNPTPYAVISQEALSAFWADNAGLLDSYPASHYLAWGNLTGVPPELVDGDDDTLGDLSCLVGDGAVWTGIAWNCSAVQGALASTYVVGPVGTATENGTALLAAAAALPAASESQPLLLKVEPGVYDLGESTLNLPTWVSLEGSGKEHTTVTSGAETTISVGDDGALRRLSVYNTNNVSSFSRCINSASRCVIADIRAVSEGNSTSQNGAIYNSGDMTTVERSTFTVLDGAGVYSAGVRNSGTDFSLREVVINLTGDTEDLTGLSASQGGGLLVMEDVLISANSSGAGDAWGVRWEQQHSEVRVIDVQIHVLSGAGAARGLYLVNIDSAEIRNSVFSSSSSGISLSMHSESVGAILLDHVETSAGVIGLYLASAPNTITLRIRQSAISSTAYPGIQITSNWQSAVSIRHSTVLAGGTFSGIQHDGTDVVTVAGSQIGGGVTGTTTCAGVWDEDLIFYSNTCP